MSGLFRFLTEGESHGEALRTRLKSVDLATKEAVVERSDVCAFPAAGIVGEAMMAIVLEEIRRNYDTYLASLKTW